MSRLWRDAAANPGEVDVLDGPQESRRRVLQGRKPAAAQEPSSKHHHWQGRTPAEAALVAAWIFNLIDAITFYVTYQRLGLHGEISPFAISIVPTMGLVPMLVFKMVVITAALYVFWFVTRRNQRLMLLMGLFCTLVAAFASMSNLVA